MYASTGRTNVTKREHFWLGVDRQGRRSSRGGGVDCDIMAQGLNRIDRILIPPRYTFFSTSTTEKNSEVKRA
jgi:hypothetical protein